MAKYFPPLTLQQGMLLLPLAISQKNICNVKTFIANISLYSYTNNPLKAKKNVFQGLIFCK